MSHAVLPVPKRNDTAWWMGENTNKNRRKPKVFHLPWRWVVIYFFGLLLAIGLVAPTNYLVEGAGPALETTGQVDGKRVISVTQTETYPTQSHFYLTTVTAWGEPDAGVTGAQAIEALLRNDRQLIPIKALYGPQTTAQQVETENAQMMTSSQDAAAVVGFELAGYDPTMTLRVAATSPEYPAYDQLHVGDVITGIRRASQKGGDSADLATELSKDKQIDSGESQDFIKVTSFMRLSQFLSVVEPGSDIDVRVTRGEKEIITHFATVQYPRDDTGWIHPGSMLGIGIEVTNVQLPGKVTYAVKDIGGPSAGNMFALTVYDDLTPGSLAAGKKIAGTGEVEFDGDVAPIGGIVHKLQGARDAGATDFLAPAENCREIQNNIPDGLNVWAVRTTQESIDVAQAIAEGETASLTSCSQYFGK